MDKWLACLRCIRIKLDSLYCYYSIVIGECHPLTKLAWSKQLIYLEVLQGLLNVISTVNKCAYICKVVGWMSKEAQPTEDRVEWRVEWSG